MRRVTTPLVQLHDVRNVTGLCKAVLKRTRRGLELTDEQYEDALAHLMCEAVAMADSYDRNIGTFEGYLNRYLPGRFVDWKRSEFGDDRNQTKRPEFLPLDDKHGENGADGADLDGFVDQIVDAVSFAADVQKLTERGREILSTVAEPIARGDSHDAVAQKLGISRRRVARMLEDLRNELLAVALGIDLTGEVPPSTDEIVEALHALERNA